MWSVKKELHVHILFPNCEFISWLFISWILNSIGNIELRICVWLMGWELVPAHSSQSAYNILSIDHVCRSDGLQINLWLEIGVGQAARAHYQPQYPNINHLIVSADTFPEVLNTNISHYDCDYTPSLSLLPPSLCALDLPLCALCELLKSSSNDI